jgi:hypothetical protein
VALREGECQYFESTDFLNPKPFEFMYSNNQWFVPEIFNQGGFDFVQYLTGASTSLRFIQVTRSSKHLVNSEYMVTFADSLMWV